MAIETLDDILEDLADMIGYYGVDRSVFVSETRERIHDAIRVENRLDDYAFHERMVTTLRGMLRDEQSDPK